MAYHVESMMKILLLMLLMMMAMKTWTGVNSQSTTDTDTCDDGADSPSVVEALTQLARYQLAASKQLSDLTRNLNDIRTNLQHMQKIPKPSVQNASTYSISALLVISSLNDICFVLHVNPMCPFFSCRL